MRLRQLSRKLEVKTDKILDFLAKTGHPMENDANGKLTEDQVLLIMAEFPSPLQEFEEEVVEEVEEKPIPEETDKIEESLVKEIDELKKEDKVLEVPLAPPADVTSQISENIKKQIKEAVESPKKTARLFKAVEEPEDDPNIELIKAPEVKLEGLKVLGKIDLPEPKPKPEKVVEEVEKEVPKRKVRPAQRNRKSVRGQHENPVERERLRQEKIAARRKRDAEQKLKDKKTENYLKQVKSKQVVRKPKRKKSVVAKPVEIQTSAPILGQSRPKATVQRPKQNKLRRFWGWLNGEYDKF